MSIDKQAADSKFSKIWGFLNGNSAKVKELEKANESLRSELTDLDAQMNGFKTSEAAKDKEIADKEAIIADNYKIMAKMEEDLDAASKELDQAKAEAAETDRKLAEMVEFIEGTTKAVTSQAEKKVKGVDLTDTPARQRAAAKKEKK